MIKVTSHKRLVLFWLFLGVLCINIVCLSFAEVDVKCSELASRRSCLRQSHFCEWRAQGSTPGVFRCETKNNIMDMYIRPYRRVGNPSVDPEAETTNRLTQQCATSVIADLGKDECYSNQIRNIDECGCMTEFERTYVIPTSKDPVVLTPELLANKTMFIFIHANKAAGETIKNIGYTALEDHQWDGAGYATKGGWQFLEQTFWPRTRSWFERRNARQTSQARQASIDAPRSAVPLGWSVLNDTNRGKIMYASCGTKYSTFDDVSDYTLEQGYSLSQARGCPLRFIWGNSGMGLCDHFPGMPCVYFIALRDPLSRALSDYNYFCVDGAEGRKKWTPEMIKAGECNIGPLQWFKSMRTSPFFFVERLSRGCDKECGPAAALANLFHPCVRYILVEQFADGLQRLRDAFHPAFSSAIDAYLDSPKRMNRRGHGTNRASLKVREISNSTLDTLRSWLKEDYLIYNEAVRRYEEQWTRPLTSCNAVLDRIPKPNFRSGR